MQPTTKPTLRQRLVQLAADPSLANASVRMLARRLGVSGTYVSSAIRELRALGVTLPPAWGTRLPFTLRNKGPELVAHVARALGVPVPADVNAVWQQVLASYGTPVEPEAPTPPAPPASKSRQLEAALRTFRTSQPRAHFAVRQTARAWGVSDRLVSKTASSLRLRIQRGRPTGTRYAVQPDGTAVRV